jgi:predicted GNAT family acetyltransferase
MSDVRRSAGHGRRLQPDAQALADASMTTEAAFQVRVIALLTAHGYACYHTHDARRSEPGFPDLIAIRGSRLLAIELKVGRYQLTTAQREWLRRFDGVREVTAMTLRGSPDGRDDLAAFENVIRRRGAA